MTEVLTYTQLPSNLIDTAWLPVAVSVAGTPTPFRTPLPLSIVGATINVSSHLILTFNDGSTLDCGVISGAAGAAGVGIVSAVVNGAGHLILTKTDATTVDAGLVVGTNGTNGVGITGVAINGAGHLIVTLSSGATVDAGVLPTGAAGAAGVGIASAAINGAGHLILTKTDTTTIDAGALPTGAATPGGSAGQLQVNGGVALAGMPAANGDGTLNTTTGLLTVTKSGGVTFGAAAFLPVGSGAGTVAAGDDSRLGGNEKTVNKGAANGYAPLDAGSKIPISNIPSSVIGALNYQGAWNASTNTPALASGVGTKGFYYKVSTSGSTVVDGISQWNAGDLIAFDGTTWDKIDGLASEVLSVVGLTGTITLAQAVAAGLAPTTSPVFLGSVTVPSWTTGTRPAAPVAGMYGFNTTLNRFDYYTGVGWYQYVNTSDLPTATTSQLYGGAGVAGVAEVVTLGTNLTMTFPGGVPTLSAAATGSGTVNAGTTNTLAFYAGNGTAVSPLTLGTNLSITGTTLNAAGVGGGTDASTLVKVNSGGGTVNTLTFNSTITEAVYDVTLTANWAPTLAGTPAGVYRRILLTIRGGAGGFTFTMPTATPGAGTIVWTGGAGAPVINTAAGALNRIWFETTDSGATVLAGY